jgi:hypothetical protein
MNLSFWRRVVVAAWFVLVLAALLFPPQYLTEGSGRYTWVGKSSPMWLFSDRQLLPPEKQNRDSAYRGTPQIDFPRLFLVLFVISTVAGGLLYFLPGGRPRSSTNPSPPAGQSPVEVSAAEADRLLDQHHERSHARPP